MIYVKRIGFALLAASGFFGVFVSDLVLEFSLFPFVGWFALTVSVLLIYPLFGLLFRDRFPDQQNRFLVFLGGAAFVLLGALALNKSFNSPYTLDFYKTRYGSCGYFGGALYRSGLGSLMTQMASTFVGPAGEYTFLIKEDTCRSLKLKNVMSLPRTGFCKSERLEDRNSCFIETMKEIENGEAMTSTGHILLMAIGALLVMKERDRNPDSDKSEMKVKYGLDLVSSVLVAWDQVQRRPKIETLLTGVNIDDIEEIPDETLKKMLNPSKEDKDEEEEFSAISSFLTDERKLQSGMIIVIERLVGEKINKTLSEKMVSASTKIEEELKKLDRGIATESAEMKSLRRRFNMAQTRIGELKAKWKDPLLEELRKDLFSTLSQ